MFRKNHVSVAIALLGLARVSLGAPFLGSFTTEHVPGREHCKVVKATPVAYSDTGIIRNLATKLTQLDSAESAFYRNTEKKVQAEGYDALVGYRQSVSLAGNSENLVVHLAITGVGIKLKCPPGSAPKP
jgi:hypothetical protein